MESIVCKLIYHPQGREAPQLQRHLIASTQILADPKDAIQVAFEMAGITTIPVV